MYRTGFAHFSQFLLVLIIFAVGVVANATPLERVFARPIIIGASVSSGMLVEGPGTIATLWVMGSDTSHNIAKRGAEGRHFKNISGETLSDYSSVIAVDFAFWDTTLSDVSESLAAISNLIRSAKAARIPLILGDVPSLSSRQNENSRQSINRQIRNMCRVKNDCHILPLNRFHQVASEQGIEIEGQIYRYSDLTIDGIHPNLLGSRYLAGQILDLL